MTIPPNKNGEIISISHVIVFIIQQGQDGWKLRRYRNRWKIEKVVCLVAKLSTRGCPLGVSCKKLRCICTTRVSQHFDEKAFMRWLLIIDLILAGTIEQYLVANVFTTNGESVSAAATGKIALYFGRDGNPIGGVEGAYRLSGSTVTWGGNKFVGSLGLVVKTVDATTVGLRKTNSIFVNFSRYID